MPARQLRLRKTYRPVERLGDLVVRPAFDVVEPDYAAGQRREPCQRTIEIDEIGSAGFGFRRSRPALFSPGLESDSGTMPGRAKRHQASAHRNAANPDAEGRLAAVVVQVLV